MTKQQRRQNPFEQKTSPAKRYATCLMRVVLLTAVLIGCGAAAVVLFGRTIGLNPLDLGQGSTNPALSPVESAFLETYLANNQEALSQPAGVGDTAVQFVISPGETANIIASNLQQANLLTDTELFINYIRYHGFDSQLEAGTFTLNPQLTVPQLAETLTRAVAEEAIVQFIEGWRIEEMADHLRDNPTANVDPDLFLQIAQRKLPHNLAPYPFLGSVPVESSLEGFLFPDTYRLPLDADAAFLVDLMLTNFGNRVTPEMIQSYGGEGLSIHEAVTLASIVEREAVINEERPIIAGVFYNRLAVGMRLEADPTVQYPLGYQADIDSWWKRPLTIADLQNQNPYNTYTSDGLPPTPIANPSLSSLEAVAFPRTTEFIFFVADCQGTPGSHQFSVTYDQHLAKVQACR
ncbi:MAG: endolytic transglycosylase MltG [Chloroflexota bacterium]